MFPGLIDLHFSLRDVLLGLKPLINLKPCLGYEAEQLSLFALVLFALLAANISALEAGVWISL